jgi:hypothetical protein
MYAYKGFNQNLTCTLGKGKFNYKLGIWYEENEARCANTGLHCCANPLDCLSYYCLDGKNRFCLVEIGGDIHEDARNRISCRRMKLIKELSYEELALHACRYMYKHPDIPDNNHVRVDVGTAAKNDKFIIVRGKKPVGAGPSGTTVYLLQEEPDTRNIAKMAVYKVGEDGIEPGKYYNINGEVKRVGKR